MPSAKIKLLRGNYVTFKVQNPVLSDGQPGFERDTGRLKIGDGSTEWLSLDYISDEIDLDIKRLNLDDSNNIYTLIEYYRKNSTLFKRSILSSYIYGDVNMDGVIDDKDYNLINGYISGQNQLDELQIKLADVTGDGDINIADLVAIQDYINNRNPGSSRVGEQITATKISDYIFRKEEYYNEDGTEIVQTINYVLEYNSNGELISEILSI